MSRARKHVTARALGECPEPGENERIMRVVAPRGSNLIEVEDPAGKNTLCLLPAKFQKMLWVRRGSFLIVDETGRKHAEESGGKVTGTISYVLFPEHVREFKRQGIWPSSFDDAGVESLGSGTKQTDLERATEAVSLQDQLPPDGAEQDSDESDDEGQVPLERNPNHGNRPGDEWESSSEDDSDTDDLERPSNTSFRTSQRLDHEKS